MERKWIAMSALALALAPAAALAQSRTADTAKTHDNTTRQTTTSYGDVSAPGNGVTAAMLKAQEDPNLIGSPAWWRTHSTADGKPLSAEQKRSK